MEFLYETIGINSFLTCPIKEMEFDSFSLKMLDNNQIEGLLPLSMVQEDEERKIRYLVTSYKSLFEYIQQPLPLMKVINILKSIAQAVNNVEGYMLYPDGLILDEKYVYVEVQSGTANLLYLPVVIHEASNINVLIFLKNLMGRFQYESPEKSGSILTVLSSINSGKISTTAQFLEELRKIDTTEKQPEGKVRKIVAEKPGTDPQNNVNVKSKSIPQVPIQPVGMKQPVESKNMLNPSSIGKKKEKDRQQEDKKGIFGLFRNGKKDESKQDQKKNLKQIPLQINFDIPGKGASAQKVSGNSAPVLIPPTIKMEQLYSVGDPENTVIITPDIYVTEKTQDELGNAYLLRVSTGQKLFLCKEINRIGRSHAYADLCITDNDSVGRIHAEILHTDGKYLIRDNDSKNHTYVNDKMLVSGEQMLLEDGAQIRLSNEKLEFHSV